MNLAVAEMSQVSRKCLVLLSILVGHCVVKIYTKTGDNGTTGLFAGPRVSKNHSRIAAYGTVDELNALLGVVAAALNGASSGVNDGSWSEVQELIPRIQADLFSIGAELATPEPDKHGMQLLSDARSSELETLIDQLEQQLPKLTSFVLPGGTLVAAHLHLARTVCRRAERDVVSLREEDPGCEPERIIVYLNRLSDLLFVLARFANHLGGVSDVPWQRP
ncbi:MAG: cob(I)yrinic acid a,c-diamide adenosyltransferase [Aureliella sp.]